MILPGGRTVEREGAGVRDRERERGNRCIERKEVREKGREKGRDQLLFPK